YPELQAIVAHMSDEDIDRLKRGGHDSVKIYAAYHAAVAHTGQPTVILAQTKKGYGMGQWGQGKMTTHQQKKLDDEALLAFRDRFSLPLSDTDVTQLRFHKPGDDSPEMKYLHQRRNALGGAMPSRNTAKFKLPIPELSSFAKYLNGTGDREQSTTMVFVQMLSQLLRDKELGKHIVPIVADEARTFGMQSLFRQVAIYSSVGQLYEPEDKDELLYYKETKDGQIIEDGITEAGAISSWLAAGISYHAHGVPMLPFYIFYSMFGFQRVGDLIWAAADAGARGFLLGATAGRTTLSGEGLQHEDGHSHVLASTVPSCVSYDPAFSYEVVVIIQDGMRRMYENGENVFYYVTMMNENYRHPDMPKGAEEGIRRGMYLLQQVEAGKKSERVQLMGSGTILREVIAAAELLAKDFGIASDVWSATSFTELGRDGMACERWNRMHPEAAPRLPFVAQCLESRSGPVIAATDYMRSFPDQIRSCVPRRFVTLGTDGFGRSDTRANLREFFEVNRGHVVIAALKALADEGKIAASKVSEAIKKYGVNTEKAVPWKS
ncbi:MAG: pyruvate dehydrogenase (acetyl-transferring), homodimeric type, partial [Burkholderiales bacterium]